MRLLDVETLGSFIKDLRQRRGMSQSQLASAAGVSRRWLTGLEAGKSTVEFGLVLKTIHALELELHVTSAMDDDAISLETVLRNLGGT